MSDQPRRKYPKRSVPAEDITAQQHIEKLSDLTDSQFAGKTIFFEPVTKPSFLIMDEAGDKSLAALARRRKNNTDHAAFGLQVPNSETKKGSVRNWRPILAVSPPNGSSIGLVEQSYETLWDVLQKASAKVFQGMVLTEAFELLYNKVELACTSKSEVRLFADLSELFKIYLEKWINDLESRATVTDDGEFLQQVDSAWQDLCAKIKLIRCIFLVLDRTYCLQRADVPTIWDMGIAMCRNFVVNAQSTEKKIFDGLLKSIERERSGDQVNKGLLKNIIRMLADLSLYENPFEGLFLKDTQTMYSMESREYLATHDISSYLKYVKKRLDEEEQRIENYLQLSTRKRLIPIVEQELIQTHQSAVIAAGTDLLMDEKRMEDLSLMYQLCSRTATGLSELHRAFCDYIKRRGRVIVMDEQQDKDMVPNMLVLKSKTDDILKNCFSSDPNFKDAAREGFEHFINQRANKPAEMIAKFVDSKLKMGNKEVSEEELEMLMDRLLILFRYIHGKDVFEAFYKKDLAKRLLLNLSASVDAEKLMLQKLKTECGSAFTSRLEGMFRDIEVSKEQASSFQEQLTKWKHAGIDVQVNVLTQGIWPNYPVVEVTLPPEMTEYLDTFKNFYLSNHNGRKLQWIHNLGQCRLSAYFPKGKKELQVSQLQAVVLLLFNNVDELGFQEIQQATSIEVEELKRVMVSLTIPKIKGVLNKSGSQTAVSVSDTFTYNDTYTAKQFRIKINQTQAQETPEEEQKTQEGIFMDRQYQIDAAIVRIMKTRKSLKHAILLSEIYKQLRFPVTPNDLKKRIESLIERDYMARDRDDQATYNYMEYNDFLVLMPFSLFYERLNWNANFVMMGTFALMGNPLLRAKRQFSFTQAATCLKVAGFYRNPQRPRGSVEELRKQCRNFYRCVGGTVFQLSCSPQTNFDIVLQGCSSPEAVTDENCALDTKDDWKPATTPHPQFENTNCSKTDYACASGQCVAKELFCNNNNDCSDGSDELVCGIDEDPQRAEPCNRDACQLPDCFCSQKGTSTPDDMPVNQVPQMVLLMFDDAINDNNIPIYDAIFTANRTNPGQQCPIKATFFVTHVFNNYQYLEKLAKSGNEIALKGVDTDRLEPYWTKATQEKLVKDYVSERKIISKFGRIPENTMTGMRMQYLKGAGNAQFDFMAKNGIKWDSSIAIEPLDSPIWPYTLDYRVPHRCWPPEKQAQCPARPFKGLWEIPLNTLAGVYDETCSVLGSCSRAESIQDMVAMLDKNFQKYYTTDRAPLVLSMSTNWFVPEHLLGLMQWIDTTLTTHKDVFFVTASQAIQWIQNPTPLDQIGGFDPWKCPQPNPVPVCDEPHGCNLEGAVPEMRGNYMITCLTCPAFYPDFGITDGEVMEA
ncbi:cullin-4A-like [Paramacrobiotus metropolitanus]|uniref:cullin-4A-like n=1 Tax=Paramacrobiotus metropolitanus TaxID=2943436 RepID=UPI002445AAB2|nr:cullin-4A-like [Paramacrobiotus metropolitanus]